jgi:hypothetical protein
MHTKIIMDDRLAQARFYRNEFGWQLITLHRDSKIPALPKGHGYLYEWMPDKAFNSIDWEHCNIGVVADSISRIIVVEEH